MALRVVFERERETNESKIKKRNKDIDISMGECLIVVCLSHEFDFVCLGFILSFFSLSRRASCVCMSTDEMNEYCQLNFLAHRTKTLLNE